MCAWLFVCRYFHMYTGAGVRGSCITWVLGPGALKEENIFLTAELCLPPQDWHPYSKRQDNKRRVCQVYLIQVLHDIKAFGKKKKRPRDIGKAVWFLCLALVKNRQACGLLWSRNTWFYVFASLGCGTSIPSPLHGKKGTVLILYSQPQLLWAQGCGGSSILRGFFGSHPPWPLTISPPLFCTLPWVSKGKNAVWMPLLWLSMLHCSLIADQLWVSFSLGPVCELH